MPTFIDLFSGCGGASCGFKMAGWTSQCAVDVYEDALKTYSKNFPESEIILGDVQSEKVQSRLRERYMGIDAVIGGPPCQGFSRRNMTASNLKKEELNKLPFVYARLAISLNPKFVMMEEVPAAVYVVKQVETLFTEAGYTVHHAVYLASQYGVPQKRKRVLMVAWRNGTFVPPVASESETTVGEALEMHPVPEKGSLVSDQQLKRIQELERTSQRLIGGNYGLMRMDRPSPTIHTESRPATGPFTIKRGPDAYHRLSVQELARLQSFPAEYQFVGGVTSVQKQVGNAVPPLLAKAMAVNMRVHY